MGIYNSVLLALGPCPNCQNDISFPIFPKSPEDILVSPEAELPHGLSSLEVKNCYQGERPRWLSALLGKLGNLSKRTYLRKTHLSVYSDREIKQYYLPWPFLP